MAFNQMNTELVSEKEIYDRMEGEKWKGNIWFIQRNFTWAQPLSILAREIPWTEEPGQATDHGVTRLRHDLETIQQQHSYETDEFS